MNDKVSDLLHRRNVHNNRGESLSRSESIAAALSPIDRSFDFCLFFRLPFLSAGRMGLLPNYARFVGKVSSRRQPSIIRELLKILSTATPEMIPLSGGLPNPDMFPFSRAQFTLKDGSEVSVESDGSFCRR